MDIKTNLKKLWNYLNGAFEQEDIIAGFAYATENFEYDPAAIDDEMIDALPEDKARDLFFDVADMALAELFGGDFEAWQDVIKNRLGFDEETIGF